MVSENSVQKWPGGGRGYWALLSRHFPLLREARARAQGRNLEAETKTEGHGGMLLIDLLRMACSACFLIAPSTSKAEVVLIIVSWLSSRNH